MLTFQTEPGKVIKPGEVLCIVGEGMPLKRNPIDKGNLFVHFTVVFPEDNGFTAAELRALEILLQRNNDPKLTAEDEEEAILTTVDPNSFGKSGVGGAAYDSDDEQPQMGGQQGVQCAQQ